MIKIENVDVFGWESAIRDMRNPMNSWDKSDSGLVRNTLKLNGGSEYPWHFEIGPNDLKLMQNLSKASPDHSKFLQFINVTLNITAPLYWWKEFETCCMGIKEGDTNNDLIDIEMNSCSTMHKIHTKEFTKDDFSCEHIGKGMRTTVYEDCLEQIIDCLNEARLCYLDCNKDKKIWWWQMIQLLPTSYNQKRTVQLNYQVLKNIYHARKLHKLDEWREFCKWIETLPYFVAICLKEGDFA